MSNTRLSALQCHVVAILLCVPAMAQAQRPVAITSNVVAVTPAPNAGDAPLTTAIQIDYQSPLATPNSVAETVKLFGSQSGAIQCDATISGSRLTLQPSIPLKLGERVSITANAAITPAIAGDSLGPPSSPSSSSVAERWGFSRNRVRNWGGDLITYLPKSADADTDDDGVNDKEEDEGPNGGDGNKDGEKDSKQSHVASLKANRDSGAPQLVRNAEINLGYLTVTTDPGHPGRNGSSQAYVAGQCASHGLLPVWRGLYRPDRPLV